MIPRADLCGGLAEGEDVEIAVAPEALLELEDVIREELREEVATTDWFEWFVRRLLVESIARIEQARGDRPPLAVGFIIARVLNRHARAGIDQQDDRPPDTSPKRKDDHGSEQDK